MRRTVLGLAALALALAATSMPALAHDGHDHITGTVARVEKGRVDVKGTDGRSTSVMLTASTAFTKAAKKASLADVKPGVRVEIEAMRGKSGLEAMEVKIGAAEAVYTCPMHPEVQQEIPGKCPKCGMHLEKKS